MNESLNDDDDDDDDDESLFTKKIGSKDELLRPTKFTFIMQCKLSTEDDFPIRFCR